ncbi:MAG TPA: transglycosylase SLT domain-containing protein [Gemmatimonadaceae bacterium]|nr:transglycosylase SLT domain-containing protein [Gemmatimonadaceae bacterium]
MRPSSCRARRGPLFPGAQRLAAPLALVLVLLATAACRGAADRTPGGARHSSYAARDGSVATAATADPTYRAAAAALAERRPWRAELVLAPALADPARRTPAAVLLAAEASAATGRWRRVDSLLQSIDRADSVVVVRARLLLARSALEQGDAAGALEHARVALAIAATDDERGRALTFVGRAQERLGARDSARAAYAAAASSLAPAGDWLTLRAASLERDGAARARDYARLRTPVARDRADYVEAQALERAGRARAAIALYEKAGASVDAMRLRAATASGTAARDRSRRELLAVVSNYGGTARARDAIEMLDAGRYRLTRDEEMMVARSAAVHGPLSRARTGFERAFRMRHPTARERLLLVAVLAESGPADRRRAERLLARMAKSRRKSPDAGAVALERAKMLRRGGHSGAARQALRLVVKRYPRDAEAAAGALLDLAEMETDARHDAAARDAYLTLVSRYPASELAPHARFAAAILAFATGKRRAAAEELDSLATLYPSSSDARAARYWSGRAYAALGDSAEARARWEPLAAAGPTSYYAVLAARRLGVPAWTPADSDGFTAFADVGEALARVDVLEGLGMALEARLEMDALAASADSSVEHVLAVGDAFRARGQMRRAMELGRRAVALGAAGDARAWRLVYPVGEMDLVATEAARRRVDPALVAAVIRQESSFEPSATSEAGARGLMQMMPRVAASLARAERIAPWDAASLYEPDVNIRLGVLHLSAFTRHYPHPALALAAYNAGQSRVARWSKRTGGQDPELFVERIRFAETRGYVCNVLVGRAAYAALYDWGRFAGTAGEARLSAVATRP